MNFDCYYYYYNYCCFCYEILSRCGARRERYDRQRFSPVDRPNFTRSVRRPRRALFIVNSRVRPVWLAFTVADWRRWITLEFRCVTAQCPTGVHPTRVYFTLHDNDVEFVVSGGGGGKNAVFREKRSPERSRKNRLRNSESTLSVFAMAERQQRTACGDHRDCPRLSLETLYDEWTQGRIGDFLRLGNAKYRSDPLP